MDLDWEEEKKKDLQLNSPGFFDTAPSKNWNRPFEAAPRYVLPNISDMSFINVSPVDWTASLSSKNSARDLERLSYVL